MSESYNNYLKKKDKKEKKKKSKFIDKLFYRIFLSSLCLLILSLFSSLDNNISKYVNKSINNNINFLQIGSFVDNIFATNIFNKGEITVYSSNFYEEVIFDNDINYVSNHSFSGVEALVDGIVIGISKIDNRYEVTIQAVDDTLYIYQDLETIDVRLYEYIKCKSIIGKAYYKVDQYQFKLLIKKDQKLYSYYENAED